MIKYYVENKVRKTKVWFDTQTQAETYYRKLQAQGYKNAGLLLGACFK